MKLNGLNLTLDNIKLDRIETNWLYKLRSKELCDRARIIEIQNVQNSDFWSGTRSGIPN